MSLPILLHREDQEINVNAYILYTVDADTKAPQIIERNVANVK